MSSRTAGSLVILLVATHVGLALAYTLPRGMVPERAYHWSVRYMRPLFHQQWNLFAPDPPACECRVQVALRDGSWRAIVPDDRHYLVHRMARPLADHLHERIMQGDTVVLPVLSGALRGLVRDIGREVPEPRFRLVERCILPGHPGRRSERVHLLKLPAR